LRAQTRLIEAFRFGRCDDSRQQPSTDRKLTARYNNAPKPQQRLRREPYRTGGARFSQRTLEPAAPAKAPAGHAEAQRSCALRRRPKLGPWGIEDADHLRSRFNHSHVALNIFAPAGTAFTSICCTTSNRACASDDATLAAHTLLNIYEEPASLNRIEYGVQHADGELDLVEDSGRPLARWRGTPRAVFMRRDRLTRRGRQAPQITPG